MMNFSPKKAVRKRKKMRIGLFGLAGSGKTHTAIMMARQLVGPEGRILVIDTERESAVSFDFLNFDVIDDLESFAPQVLTEALYFAARENYHAVVVDSMTAFWTGKDGSLQQAERAKSQMNGGNNWNSWAKVTPAQDAMTDAILAAPFHVFLCIRGKEKTNQGVDPGTGRKTIVSEGVQPVQKDGWDYEMDVFLRMTTEHDAVVQKTRVNTLDGAVFHRGEGMVDLILEWLQSAGAEESPRQVVTYVDAESYIKRAKEIAKDTVFFKDGTAEQKVVSHLTKGKSNTLEAAFSQCTPEFADALLVALERQVASSLQRRAAPVENPPAEGPLTLTEKTRKGIAAHCDRVWGKGVDATKSRAAFLLHHMKKQAVAELTQEEGQRVFDLLGILQPGESGIPQEVANDTGTG